MIQTVITRKMTSKIQILTWVKQIFELVGVLPVKDQTGIVKRLKIGALLFPLVICADIAKMTEALVLCIAIFIAIMVCSSVLVDRVQIECMLQGLQCLVNERKCRQTNICGL